MHHMHPNLNGTKLDRVGVKIELGSISAVRTLEQIVLISA